MAAESSDTELIQLFKLGDREAANLLIERYFDRAVRAARLRLAHFPPIDSSGDDIAASVFESLWQRASENRFSDDELQDSEELWRLLYRMIDFKSKDHFRRAAAFKRNGGFNGYNGGRDNPGAAITNAEHQGFSSECLAIFREEHQRMLTMLEDDTLAQIAVMRLEGYKVTEIAEQFGKSHRWVGRKLSLIRDTWKAEVGAAICD